MISYVNFRSLSMSLVEWIVYVSWFRSQGLSVSVKLAPTSAVEVTASVIYTCTTLFLPLLLSFLLFSTTTIILLLQIAGRIFLIIITTKIRYDDVIY